MKSPARFPLLLLLLACALPVRGQGVPPVPDTQERERAAVRGLPPEERELRREEHRRRHEARRQMSPEERDQLRRDIRAAGREIYPHGPRWHRD